MVDEIYVHPEKLYSTMEFEEKLKELKRLRREAIEKVGEGLHPKIRNALD